MVTAVINLDFLPLFFFFFFLYSALEILIARTMDDYSYRSIQIQHDEDEASEDDDEFEASEDEDYNNSDRSRRLIPERTVLPLGLDVFNTGELEDEDESDYDDEDEDEDEEDDENEFDYDDEDVEDEEEEEELMPPPPPPPRRLPVPMPVMLRRDPIEEDYYEDEDDEEEEEYGEDDDEEDEDGGEYEEEVEVEVEVEVMTSPRVSSSVVYSRTLHGVVVNLNDREACGGSNENGGGESHGLCCPICFEAWTSGGEHQICCLPCGHIYGLSCIKKWLQQARSSGKCPQCNKLCTFKDVRVLYASRLCIADEELHKRVRSLEAKCAHLEQKAGKLTTDELIDQICSNPVALQRLAMVLSEWYRQPVSP